MAIDQQTIEDLEFPTIREWLGNYASGPTAKDRLAGLQPSTELTEIKSALAIVDELKAIREEGELFPRLEFEEITDEIRLLPITNATIALEGFMRIHDASQLVNALLYFFDKRDKDYPLLHGIVNEAYFTKEISTAIERVFDKYGNVKDDASDALSEIRGKIRTLRRQINRNFDREVRKLRKENMLGDTTETFINERRVLTVISNYKRRVSGTIVGSSKTGSFTYIEPEANVGLNNELELVLDDERKEIFRILQLLRKELSAFLPLIRSYQTILSEMDFINAKCRLAIALDCSNPSIEKDQVIELIDAYHPILWKANRSQKKPTFPQQIKMDKFSRMLVISGPNAGGKSITLKSIGLLQLMLQSGLLVPVHPNSKMCIFRTILSDIGDNQSIANELSTYSYRLKRMKMFLDEANKSTLLLLDEFGTGSDPDLGGALAEAIFEAFYNRKSFGVITTHYANIKLKADRLKNSVNGCMLFNTETLEPTYRFSAGQPGSSFTFEVAEINGIPKSLIDEAKNKLDEKKVRMDRLLNELQKEKTYLERLNKEHIEAQKTAQQALNNYTAKRAQYESKIKAFNAQSEANHKLLQSGKKTNAFIQRYITNSRKKTANNALMEDVRKFLAVEKSKLEVAKKEAQQKASGTTKQSGKKKKKTAPDQFGREKIVVGSKVKLIATRQSGIVEEISKDTVVVVFGFARMKVAREKLMWIQ